MNAAEIRALDQQYILQTYGRYPIAIVRGSGTRVWDADGKEYLDFLGGIAVNPLGHCHPAVVAAVVEQAQTLMHISNLYYTRPAVELANLLVENGALERVFFCNSGAEANEGAIKLARKYHWRKGRPDKYGIVSMSHSFHGRTLGALAATAKKELQEGFGPMPAGFVHVEWGDATALAEAVDEHTAAVLIEPVQGEGGIYPATVEYLKAVRAACDRAGAVLIFDEIQCGLGRTGTLFAYQAFGVKPDIITMAKGIASGMPLGCFAATAEVAEGFRPGDHGTTFGANPVACAAALATIRTLLREEQISRAGAMGDYLMGRLRGLQARYPAAIAEVRGRGLMIGIEYTFEAKPVLELCHQYGLLANVTAGKVLRLLPPYVITNEEADQAVAIVQRATAEVLANQA
jgi:acetylornithine/N-succinyldiaminopimelate aminotransferase